VALTLPELAALVDYLEQKLPAAQREALASRCAAQAAAEQQAPCPLLDERGACSVYEARPLACRAHTAYDEAECLRHHRDPSAPQPRTDRLRMGAALKVQMHLVWPLVDDGLHPSAALELVPALAIALRLPQPEWTVDAARWAPAEMQSSSS
jgi:hypothetical protein